MNLITKFILTASVAATFAFSQAQAAQSERLLSIALSGFLQDQTHLGDDIAVPFRVTTRDILEEITLATGTNVTDGVLLLVDSLDDTNGVTHIVARTRTREIDVTDLFEINHGNDVRTSKFSGNTFKSATFYAIDHFLFSTINTSGIELTFQGLTKESQRALIKVINGARQTVTATTSRSDGNGELSSDTGFIGPVKGSISVGTPKFVGNFAQNFLGSGTIDTFGDGTFVPVTSGQ